MPNTQFLPGRLLCMGLLALALAGCAGSGGARPQERPPPTRPAARIHWRRPPGNWCAGSSPAALRDIPHGDNGEPVKLVFLAQGKQYRVNGFAGCNRYMGTYRIEGGRLRIDAPAATRMACPTPERAGLEADYLRGLGSIDTFTLDNGGAPRHLTFNLRGGDVAGVRAARGSAHP